MTDSYKHLLNNIHQMSLHYTTDDLLVTRVSVQTDISGKSF